MKIIYFWTPEFSAQILESILELAPQYEAEVVGVVSQPDKPIGRQKILQPTPVKRVAQDHTIPVYQPDILKNNTSFFQTLRQMDVDFIVVVAYGKIIPPEILEIPRYGCINIHGSILPKYRWASPVQAAIAEGQLQTWLTIMYMSEGMDEGDILQIREIQIDNLDTSPDMFKKFVQVGPALLLETLQKIERSEIEATPQDTRQATYCWKITREDGEVFFQTQTAQAIYNQYRAYQPWPGIYTFFNEKRLQLEGVDLYTDLYDGDRTIGEWVQLWKNRYGIIAADGNILEVLQVKLEGKKSMDTQSFVNGNADVMGYVFA